MKIIAFLGVKDEVELIESTIIHLRSIGIDFIVITDLNSKDGTAEILDRYKSETCWVIQLGETPGPEAESQLATEYLDRTNADWAIFLDADELWLPLTGNLKECEALVSSDVISVDRYNVPLLRTGPVMPTTVVPERYNDLMLYVEPIQHFYKTIYENPEIPWNQGVPMPKVMVRASVFGKLTVGAHDVVACEGIEVRRAKASDVIIAHIPFSSLTRFSRKVRNICNEFPDGPNLIAGAPQTAWHWRRWMVLAEQGKLEDEFQRQFIDEPYLVELLNRRIVKRASDIFIERTQIA